MRSCDAVINHSSTLEPGHFSFGSMCEASRSRVPNEILEMEDVAYARIDEGYGTNPDHPDPEVMVDVVDFMRVWWKTGDVKKALFGVETVHSFGDIVYELSVGRCSKEETWRRFCYWSLHQLFP